MGLIDIPVIYYHSVGRVNNNWARKDHTMELFFFESQLRWFARHYNIISLKEYWQIRNGFSKEKKKTLVITFDDGFLDNWVYAFPVLSKYNVRASIFVSPELVDKRDIVRPNYDNYKNGDIPFSDLPQSGYMSWPEMKIMQDSGLIDIESHTLSHTKYFCSDKLTGFHHSKNDSLYLIGNHFPERKPYYIDDKDFNLLLPEGYPIFKQVSSVIATRVWINESFNEAIISGLSGYDFSRYNFEEAYSIISHIYTEMRDRGDLISRIETEEERRERLADEIILSKKIIEENLHTKVEFICWPHGDNSEEAHNLAIKAGYLASTMGKFNGDTDNPERIAKRIGMSVFRNNRLLSDLRADFRIRKEFGTNFLYRAIDRIYKLFK